MHKINREMLKISYEILHKRITRYVFKPFQFWLRFQKHKGHYFMTTYMSPPYLGIFCPKKGKNYPTLQKIITVIPRLTNIIRSGITFVSRNVMLSGVSLFAVSNVNNPVGLVGLPYVMWSAHFFVTHIQTEKISSWNGPTVHVCCFMLARTSTKTFVSRIHIR